jgi:hypothetical protein
MSGTGSAAQPNPLSDTDIANMALLAAGARSQITAFNDPGPDARYVRLFYNQTRDAMLRGAHWNFTRTVAYLTLLLSAPGTPENPNDFAPNWQPGVTPPPPWAFEYAFPADCLLFRMISPQMPSGPAVQGIPFFSAPSWVPPPNVTLQPQRFVCGIDTIDGQDTKVVLSMQDQAIGVYTKRITNPALWDDRFRDGFIAALAARLCIPVSGNLKLIPELKQEAMRTLLDARLSDGNEGFTMGPDTDRVPDWIRIRGYAGDWMTGSYYTQAWTSPTFLLL